MKISIFRTAMSFPPVLLLLLLSSLLLDKTMACGSLTYSLVAGGGDGVGTVVGEVVVLENNAVLEISVSITSDLTPNDVSDDSSPTLITEIHAEANCLENDFPINPKSGAIKNGQMEVNMSFDEGVKTVNFALSKPDCGEDRVLVAVHTNVEKLGGLNAINSLFPVSVEYIVTFDDGAEEGASYFDTEFVGSSPLNGLEIDGYCVDVGHFITTETQYSGTAYSYLDSDLSGTNIDQPQNLDLVAWAINNFFPGQTYVADVNSDEIEETYTMSSGTLQRAIWYIIDFEQSTGGLGEYDEEWALYIASIAEEQDGYEPDCGDLLPIVLIPDSDSTQHTIVQTTFAALQIPCEGSDETAWAVMPDMTPIGFQFSSKNWATYVEYESCQ